MGGLERTEVSAIEGLGDRTNNFHDFMSFFVPLTHNIFPPIAYGSSILGAPHFFGKLASIWSESYDSPTGSNVKLESE